MRFRLIIAAILSLLPSLAGAYDPARAPGYGSPDMYRPNMDSVILRGNNSRGQAGGLSVGGGTLGGGLIPSVLTLLDANQAADVRSGNPTIDLAPVLKATLNTCMPGLPLPNVDIPAGVVVAIKSEIFANACKFRLNVDGEIRQIAVFPSSPDAPQAIIHISGNAKGSIVTGSGKINGNRAALISAYSALPTIPVYGNTRVTGQEQSCILAQYVDYVTISEITTEGCLSHALNVSATRGARILNVKVKDSSKVWAFQSNDHFVAENIVATDIGNQVNGTPIPTFNYAFETRDLTHFRIAGVRLNGYSPLQFMGPGATNGIGDPKPGGFHGESLSDGTIEDVQLDGYTYADARAVNSAWGGVLSGLTDVNIRSFKAKGFFSPLEIDGPTRVTLDGFNLDCNWNTAGGESIGLLARGAGMTPKNIASPQDHWTNQPGYDLTISNGNATRCSKGALLATGNTLVNSVRFNGNLVNGLLLWSTLPNNATFPGAILPYLGRVTVANSEAQFNGQAGVQINDAIGVDLPGLHASNNGQEQPGGGFQAGVLLLGPGLKDRITMSAWSAGDDQSFTLAKNASFIPGKTDSSNRFSMVMASGERLAVGQHVLIKNGTGSADINVKILDITNDVYTAQTASTATFSETGNLTNLAGKVSLTAGSQTLSGSGTAFAAAITGPVYLKVGGQYVKVIRVISDTLALIETGAPATVSGVSAQLVQATVAGIPSQNFGINDPAGQNVSRFSFGPYGSYSAEGNLIAGTTIGDFSSLVDGQEVLIEGGVINANTTSGDTQLIGQVGANAQAVSLAYRVKVVSTIMGTAGPVQVLLGANQAALPLASMAVAAGSAAGGPIANGQAWGWVSPDVTNLTARVPSTPTGGQYRGDLLVRKVGLRPFAN